MPCSNCMAPYTAFRKEHGCSGCSFSFCAKCLPQKAIIPQLSRQPVSVCQNCYEKLTHHPGQNYRQANLQYHSERRNQGDIRPGTTTESYRLSPIYAKHTRPSPASTQCCTSCYQPSAKDDEIRNRLDRLKAREDSDEKASSVGEIEERLAKLRGVSVEEIRSPSLMFVQNRKEMPKETVKDLMEKAKAEAKLEKKWDPARQLQQRYNDYHGVEEPIEQEEEIPIAAVVPGSNQGALASADDDILMSEETIRGMKDLKKTLADARTVSEEASASFADEGKMKNEMREILKITRQKSMTNEKINAEMKKFWDRSIDKYSGEGSESAEDRSDSAEETAVNEVDEAEFKKIIQEAEQAVDEEKQEVKKSRKQQKKQGFFSKLFRSQDS